MATSDYSSTFTSSNDGECLFQSPAQIMVRQDIGWEPMGMGGLSRIEVKQKPNILNEGFEYFIEAYKLTNSNEKNLSLECKLDSDTSYYRINPTFHCWTTRHSRIGLTFDTYEAAENFEKLFHEILKRLDKGTCNQNCEFPSNPPTCINHNNNNNKEKNTKAPRIIKEELVMKTWGSCQHIGQGDIPCQMKCFQSPPAACSQIHDCITSPNLDSLSRHYHSPSAASAPCLLRLNIGAAFETVPSSISNDGPPPAVSGWLARLLPCLAQRNGYDNRLSRSSGNSDSCNSRQRSRRNPRTSQDGPSCTSALQDSSVSNEGTSGDNMMAWLPPKRARNSHRPGILICVYCRRRFRPQSNPPGSCELAPDKARQLVDLLTCRPCGHRFIKCFYHSISNPSVDDSDLSDSLPSPYACCCGSAPSPPDPGDNNTAAYSSSTANTLRVDYRVNKTTTALPPSSNKCQRLKTSRSGRRKRCLLCLMYCVLPCVCCYRPCLSCYESCLDRGLVGGRHSVVVHHRSQH